MQRSTILGISALVALVALSAGLLGIGQRGTSFTATAQVLVVPATSEDRSLDVSAADTLSRGPIVSTFARAYASSEVVREALREARFTAADAARVSVSTVAVTDTTAILIEAKADSAALAERAANAVAGFKPDLAGYTAAFLPQVIGTADGSATRAGASTRTLVLIALFLSLALGVLTAAVLDRLFRPVARPREERPQPAGAAPARVRLPRRS